MSIRFAVSQTEAIAEVYVTVTVAIEFENMSQAHAFPNLLKETCSKFNLKGFGRGEDTLYRHGDERNTV